MTKRYYVERLPPNGGPTTLPREEADHALRVMRVSIGDEVTLFDGRGQEASATVFHIDRHGCTCDAQLPKTIHRESAHLTHVATALPKPDRAKEMVERLVELGVDRVTPLVCQRSQRPTSPNIINKLRRLVIEASKQCGRNWLMKIDDPISWSEFLEQTDAHSAIEKKWILHVATEPATILRTWATQQRMNSRQSDIYILDTHQFLSRPRYLFAIGPEGGWSDEEVTSAVAHGFECLSLGNRILRIETAATVIASWMS
jgi:16S rRNA (uracil1498-N3)-methyltransferase